MSVDAIDRIVATQNNPNGFYKADQTTVVFTKTGNGTASIKAGTIIDVNGTVVTFSEATAITMPTLAAGTDYAVWVKADGTIQATTNFTAPPTGGSWRRIGGFHYAPGGNATAQAGGNTTAQINEYSFWDVKFRPACTDPRGMTLVADEVWFDIYLTGVDAITNGSSRYNVAIADGSNSPKIPSMFGGNGTTTYGGYTWFEAMEMAFAFGKKCPTQQEFMSAAYGTTEATASGGTDVPTTGVSGTGATNTWEKFTSKWGLIQATGCMGVWARDRGGPAAAASWNANTESRGSEYNAPNVCKLGGDYGNAANAGSRSGNWIFVANNTDAFITSRFCADHVVIE